MKKETEELTECCTSIRKEIARWKYINEHGCNDPFWTDGTNMNLVRNHIIYYKEKIFAIASSRQTALPEEYYLATPPAVDNDYMANYKQTKRVNRVIRNTPAVVVHKKHYKYDELQISLF